MGHAVVVQGRWVLTLPVLSVDMLRVSRLGHRGRQLGTGEVPGSTFSAGGAWGGYGKESWMSQHTQEMSLGHQ